MIPYQKECISRGKPCTYDAWQDLPAHRSVVMKTKSCFLTSCCPNCKSTHALAILIAVMASATTHSQWTATILNPSGTNTSESYGAGPASQVGAAKVGVGGVWNAGYWAGSAGSWVNLNPVGFSVSYATAADSNSQVGYTVASGASKAALWTGTAGSFVSLHSPEHNASEAWGVRGGHQVGFTMVSGVRRASLWSGTAASRIDLNPAGAASSIAYATDGDHQVGYASIGGAFKAALWGGTSASFVNLNPTGCLSSTARAADGTRQVGHGYFADFYNHALLWNGTAQSVVDLHPNTGNPLTLESFAYGGHGGWQVGETRNYLSAGSSLYTRLAAAWNGTPGSWESLHGYLPSTMSSSVANGVWSSGETLYVSGWAKNDNTGTNVAVLWTKPLPFRGTLTGSVTLGDYIPSPSGRLLDLQVYSADGSVLEWAVSNVALDPQGTFTVSHRLPDGSYDIRIKASHWLARIVDNVALGPNGNAGLIALINGDVDNDNEVGPGDFGGLSSSFGTVNGDANWNADADLDGDGEVGPSDFGILSASFGLTGD